MLVVPVSNLNVEIAGMSSFRPTGVSRIAINVPIVDMSTGGVPAFAPGTPLYPPFKLMLGADAPFAELAQVWAGMLSGVQTDVNLTVRLQASAGGFKTGFTDIAWFEIEDSYLVGFSDGTVSAAYIVIQPGQITLHQVPGATHNLAYASVDLPVQNASMLFGTLTDTLMIVYQSSGGDQTVALSGGVFTVGPLSEVSVTTVARTSTDLLVPPNIQAFDPLREWVNGVLTGGSSRRTVVLNSLSFAGVMRTAQLNDCIPSRITLIDPVLVNVNGGVAPYVFDLRLKPTSVQ
jgi:hypothetical protein